MIPWTDPDLQEHLTMREFLWGMVLMATILGLVISIIAMLFVIFIMLGWI